MNYKIYLLWVMLLPTSGLFAKKSLSTHYLMNAIIRDMPYLYKQAIIEGFPCPYLEHVCKCKEDGEEIKEEALILAFREIMKFLQCAPFRCVHGGHFTPIIINCSSACATVLKNNCQSGPIKIGTLNPTSLTLATNGCSDRMVIDENGAVLINMPTSGEALTVDGNIVLPAVNMAETQGILKLGGGDTGHINVYESGIQNFFAGSGTVNSVVTGTNNISIGTLANNTLITGNNTIAIGTSTFATQSDSVVLGNSVHSDFPRTIVIGSKDSINIGSAPTASAPNAIAIGSAHGTGSGAIAGEDIAIACGGSAGTTSGAVTSGRGSIAIGCAARTNGTQSIAIGGGTSNTNGAVSSGVGSMAIGGGNNINDGASTTAQASVAIGSAEGLSLAALTTAIRTMAVGCDSRAAVTGAISLGSGSGAAAGAGPFANGISSIAIGSAHENLLAPQSLTDSAIAIGSSNGVFNGAVITGIRGIAIGSGTQVNTSGMAIGSASGTIGGSGARVAGGGGAIAIGSACNEQEGAASLAQGSTCIGSANRMFAGATTSAIRAVTIGVNAQSTSTGSVVLGGASDTAGGAAPVGNNTCVVIGSAWGSLPGAQATGTSGVAIGGADGISSGAAALADRVVAIGCGASCAMAERIVLGNAANTAVRVGIGTETPGAKLDIVGANGTPVIRFNQVSTNIASAPAWMNRSTGVIAETPIHYNASGQFFCFTSSSRYKANIRPMDNESEIIYLLRPVLYDAKEGHGQGEDIPGFIAEEVWEVAPHLVVLNEERRPENIAYNSFHVLAIRELQKHQVILHSHAADLQAQKTILEDADYELIELGQSIENLISG